MSCRCFDSKSLEKIDFGEGVSNIDEYAFYGCSSLSVICLPQKVRKIPYFAFGYCKNLTGITLPKDIEKIEDNAFKSCKDNGVGPFSNTENLKKITIGENVREINKYEFANCAEVKSLRLPDSLTKIGQYAFEGCGMKTIDIPKSVQNIGDGAFSGCVNVSSLNLAEGVVSIGDYAFSGCVNLSEVNSMNVNVPKCKGAAVFDSNVYLNAELYVPQEALSAYQEADVWKNFLSISGKQFGGAELIYNDLTVAVNGFDLIVNAQEGVAVNVYNVAGQCIYSGANHQVQLPACGVYIVNVGGKVSKILVK